MFHKKNSTDNKGGINTTTRKEFHKSKTDSDD